MTIVFPAQKPLLHGLSSQNLESKSHPVPTHPEQWHPHFPMALLRPLLALLVMCNYALLAPLVCDLPQSSPMLSRKTFMFLGQMRRVLLPLSGVTEGLLIPEEDGGWYPVPQGPGYVFPPVEVPVDPTLQFLLTDSSLMLGCSPPDKFYAELLQQLEDLKHVRWRGR